ncbi:MAG: haloacid dehalogenase [Cyanobacteria bacterium J06554_3]
MLVAETERVEVSMANRIILTALEGALVGSLDDEAVLAGAIAQVKPTVQRLMDLDMPIVVFTQRDRAELEPIREQLGLTSPFITESGSAIFTPVDHNPFATPLGEKDGQYFVEQLGCPYVQARAGLRVIANEVSHPLKGFGDFTVPQLQKMAKLTEPVAHRAKAREFSEPFMTPKAVDSAVIRQAAEEMGFGLIVRSPEESRFSELLGAGAGIEPAAKQLIEAYAQQADNAESWEIIGIGHREADLSMLAAAAKQAGAQWVPKTLKADAPEGWVNVIDCLLEKG